MPIASPVDVAVTLLRDLTPNEAIYVEALLDRAEAHLTAVIPELPKRAEVPEYASSVRLVESQMVARVLRNPDGVLSETNGLYSYSVDVAVASGRLRPSRNELIILRTRPEIAALQGGLDEYARLRYPSRTGVHPFRCGG